jgi:RimJ/RimL family protein N-acetyltransferase
VIRTERLLLRRARIEDLPGMHSVLSDPQAMRYWATPPHADIEETRRWLMSMIEADPALSDDYIIEYQGEVIGKAGCWRLPEIGFILRRDRWRMGLAFEALNAAIAELFRTRGLTAITADVDPRNAASLGVLHKLGFRETHRAANTWLIAGEWCDSVYLRLDRR